MMLLDIQEPGTSSNQPAEKATIGIDLGTTNSLVAISNQGIHEVIGEHENDALTPSVVSYTDDAILVGNKAKHVPNAIYSIKRLMGKSKNDITQEESSTYHITGNDSTVVMLSTPKKPVSAVEISAEILKYLKHKAEQELENEVGYAVITVPAYFDETARQATKDAAALAGLEVLRLVNEPTAAALAYGLDHSAEGIYAIYDLGGGTFDVSLLKMEKGVFQVLATGGDTSLGGDDIDRIIVETIKTEHFANKPLSVEDNISLKSFAKSIKEHLSNNSSFEGIFTLNNATYSTIFTQEKLHTLITPIIAKTVNIFTSVLNDANIEKSDIKGVVLVGGSTRTPAIADALEIFIGCKPLSNVDPDKVVAIGAAIQAESLSQGSNNLLLDVTPLSLGIETYGGLVETLIHRNTPIPTMASQKFTTYKDGQTGLSVHVLQGEREMVDACRSLAKFELKNIPPMKAGATIIEITFMLDADGLLTVTAKEETTGTVQSIEVKPSYGFTSDQIEQMLIDSMENAQSDITRRLLAESKVDAEITINAIETALLEDGEILEKNYFDAIKHQIEQLKSLLQTEDRDNIDLCVQELDKLTSKFAELRVNKALNDTFSGQNLEKVSEKVWEEN